jgi:hypothetical protein
MSHTYVAGVVAFLSAVLPLFGFQIADSVVLTNFVTNVITAAAALYVIYRRITDGDVSVLGIRKS